MLTSTYKYRNKIVQTMIMKPKEILISNLLSTILFNAVVFDRKKHFKLIELLIETVKVLSNYRSSLFCKLQTATVLTEIIVDFLYRFKDRHPYSNPKNKVDMDMFYAIIECLIPNGYLPSVVLINEYGKSKLTKELNTLPSLEYLNSKFDETNQMSEEVYSLLKKRFESRPLLVFYFNPDFELQEQVAADVLKIGFFDTDGAQIGAGMKVYNSGEMYQGYFNGNSKHTYGRLIDNNGDIYEGGWEMGCRKGKGEWEYKDGTKEIGQWDNHSRQGEFECYNKTGTLTHRKIYEDDKLIKSEQVASKISRQK